MSYPRKTEFALAAASGLMLAGAFAPLRLWALAWPALVPLFYAAARSRNSKTAALLGFTTGVFFYPLSLSWMPNATGSLGAALWGLFCLWTALQAALLRRLWDFLGGKGAAGHLAWAAMAGITWAGIEYFRSELWGLACPWLGLGYSQAGSPQILQTLSVWGLYGLSALIASTAAALALFARRSRVPAAVFVTFVLLSALWGGRRIADFNTEDGTPVKTALVQAEAVPLDTLIRYSLEPEAAAADLLVWPENSFMLDTGNDAQYLAGLVEKLRPSRAVAALGSGRNGTWPGTKRENFMLFFSRDKSATGRYDKMHPVPFVEAGLLPGRAPNTVDTQLGSLGPQICYDLAFEDGSRKLAQLGAQLLVSPTLDPMKWGVLQHEQHSDMSGARAIETGLWLVRAASSGRSQIIDPLGISRAELETGKEGVLTGTAYMRAGGTFYTRLGWLFAPFALALTAAAALPALLRRK